MYRFLPIILFFACYAYAQITLSGNIGGMSLDSSSSPYLITDNVTVNSGKTLTIHSGTVLLFKPFTGLIIEDGNLIVNGTIDKPVIFTTENDNIRNPESNQLPNPFDWNGVLILPKAGNVTLSNFILEYSVYGIKSQKEGFSINNGTFKANGQFHLTVGESIKPVIDGLPFNYGTKSNVSIKHTLPNKKLIWLGSGGLTGVGTVVSSILLVKSRESYRNESNSKNLSKYRSQIIGSTMSTAILGTATVILLPIGIFSKSNKKSPSVTSFNIIPSQRETYIQLSIDY